MRIGRVAAGAIAEHYLQVTHGVEIIAFVSGVGKVHLPTTPQAAKRLLNGQTNGNDSDEEEDLSSDYMDLLNSVTREQVDSTTVRCPHAESAQKMEEVSNCVIFLDFNLGDSVDSASSKQRKPTIR